MKSVHLLFWMSIPCLLLSQNLIINGDFDTQKDTLPSSWSLRQGEDNVLHFKDDQLVLSAEKGYVVASQHLKRNTFDPGFYILQVDIASVDAQGRVYFSVNLFDADSASLGRRIEWRKAPTGTTESARRDLYVFIDSESSIIRIDLGISDAGIGKFDNIVFRKVPLDQGNADPSWTSWVDTFMMHVKDNSIKTDSMDWEKLYASSIKGKASIRSEKMAIAYGDYILSKVNDGHSFIVDAEQVKAWYGNPATNEESDDDTGSSQDIPAVQPFDTAEGRFYETDVGYLTVPHIGSGNKETLKAFGHEIRKRINELNNKGATKWIVDLRENTGGNMWPMIAGVGPFFEEGQVLGSFVRNNSQSNWLYKDNASHIDDYPSCTLDDAYNVKLKQKNPKIAVLVGPKTASSGEFTFMSFIGRPNTRSFGSSTGGYTTGNSNFNLPNGAMLFLAASIGADRTGHKYGEKIQPDVLTEDDSITQQDEVIETAIKWLKE